MRQLPRVTRMGENNNLDITRLWQDSLGVARWKTPLLVD
jgi:hypothetical protein